LKILLTSEQLAEGVARLAREINGHYHQQPLVIVGVMTGSLVLVADLIRQLDMPLRVGVVQARSYRGGATSPGELAIHAELLPELARRHVLLVDDIFDTGHTLAALLAQMQQLAPASLRSAVLLSKLGQQQVTLRPDHVAFEIPNEFVVGYGLDYQDEYRNLPYVAALEAAELAASIADPGPQP
jgi:hypoxanthine phosphoribosyltransferase